MNFSDPLPTNSIADFSQCGEYIAISKANKVNVFETSQLNSIAEFTSDEPVSYLEWSPDSGFILLVMKKSAKIQIFAI
jgi:uncharacterized protein with WD repeat